MSRNGGTRSSASGKHGSLVAGIMIGMVLGLAVAGGVAWYIVKTPSPYLSKEPQHEVKPEVEAPKPVAPATQVTPASTRAASGVGETKPRFEFYKVLTDKPEGTTSPKSAGHPVAPVQKETSKPVQPSATLKETYFLQAGSFSNADDADKLKAKLALLGMEANVQTVTIPDKGVWHRVRLGPYSNAEEMNKARGALKQNGVDATPMHAQ